MQRLPITIIISDITAIVGRDIGLMIRAFAAALEDDNLLVRRSALDMLLQTMRIDSAAMKRAKPEDTAILMKAAVGVVLRRDLSLNRRLYTWLLGPDEKSEVQSEYLRQHALQLLSSTLRVRVSLCAGTYLTCPIRMKCSHPLESIPSPVLSRFSSPSLTNGKSVLRLLKP